MQNAAQGKVIVITGATSGLGQIAASELAAAGARLVLVARDRARADRMLAYLRERGPKQAHSAHIAELSRIAEVKRVGSEIAAAEPHIDVLINNAGNIYGSRQLTEDGLERTFATNHVAYYVLTLLLRDRLVAAAPARIVNTASAAHRGEKLDFDDLQFAKHYRPQSAYGRSKLCNILFTRALARRLAGTGVTVNCLHPGFSRTNLGQRDGSLFAKLVGMAFLFAGRPERGANTIVYLATSPAVAEVSGGYFIDSRPATPSAQAQDDASAERLWMATARVTGIG
jgi:NAD(P)-dependent dehydrogenase (short-subunit alcohol dehydrogenase family)